MSNAAFKLIILFCIFTSALPSVASSSVGCLVFIGLCMSVADSLPSVHSFKAQELILQDTVHVDSVGDMTSDSLVSGTKKKTFFQKFLDYFNDANKNKKNKRFDFSIIGGPHYSTDTELGLGLVAAGLYRTTANDTVSPPSNVSLFSDVSTVGFYLLGIRGNHLMRAMKNRIDYKIYFFSFPR